MRLCEKMQADYTAAAPTCVRLLDKVKPRIFRVYFVEQWNRCGGHGGGSWLYLLPNLVPGDA